MTSDNDKMFPGGIRGTRGFLDQDDIQTEMTGVGSDVPSPVCLYTVKTVSTLLCALNNTRGSACTGVGHANSIDYVLKATPEEIQQVVDRRFSGDMKLWSDVTNHNGKFCFGIP
jgi:hypothetical protein